jgi:hypothetical protein
MQIDNFSEKFVVQVVLFELNNTMAHFYMVSSRQILNATAEAPLKIFQS